MFASRKAIYGGSNGTRKQIEFVAFSNARMFNYVVSKEDVCQKLVERILGIRSRSYRVRSRGTLNSGQACRAHGVRLDVRERRREILRCGDAGPNRILYRLSIALLSVSHRLRSPAQRDGIRRSAVQLYNFSFCVNDPLGSGLPVYTVAPQCEECQSAIWKCGVNGLC